MKTYLLEIVTPERKVYSDDVEMLITKAESGEIGILAGHTPLVASLAIGPLRVKKNGAEILMSIMKGFMEVTETKVVILAEAAELAEEIDIDRAMRAKERAEERIRAKEDVLDFKRAELALQRAVTRIKVSGK
ncbi:F0F1 ATP synthase subunit epsilon [Desulfuribacillus alkaliarsenatis]|uniref:ATP synthase epsilon chain n=1 Tax=Desulfuribacillus alkaliarsenatis TaxID=766136 RepID=A0A1E5G2L9_9FIRM|nr:F0F1 ATP synthase subunit epsilon [Desulfuribacillus alkaliarsenatis]OEF96781.1 F0F1 ATP synthase subunit epsilon [Desulfuribacillus alkaliarsenatis]